MTTNRIAHYFDALEQPARPASELFPELGPPEPSAEPPRHPECNCDCEPCNCWPDVDSVKVRIAGGGDDCDGCDQELCDCCGAPLLEVYLGDGEQHDDPLIVVEQGDHHEAIQRLQDAHRMELERAKGVEFESGRAYQWALDEEAKGTWSWLWVGVLVATFWTLVLRIVVGAIWKAVP